MFPSGAEIRNVDGMASSMCFHMLSTVQVSRNCRIGNMKAVEHVVISPPHLPPDPSHASKKRLFEIPQTRNLSSQPSIFKVHGKRKPQHRSGNFPAQ